MGFTDYIIEGGKELIIGFLNAIVGGIGDMIRGLLGFLTQVIRDTPYPTQAGSELPILFGVPSDPLWNTLYTIYAGSAQPYAYLLWFFAVIAVQFSSMFDGVIPGWSNETTKKKLMVAFLGITMWWPLGVMILSFSDALGTLLYNLGVPGDPSNGVGLAKTFDVVNNNLQLNNNYPALVVTTILWLVELLVLLILSLVWFVRIAAIYVLMPLMPIMIAMWALDIPGMDALKAIGSASLKGFTQLAFITIPGALIIGFSGTIIEIAAEVVSSQTGAEFDLGDGVSGSSHQSVVQPQIDATADPVGALSSVVIQQDPTPTSKIGETGVVAQQSGIVDGAVGIGEGLVASLIFALVIMSIPILAALAPAIMVKYMPGTKSAMGVAGMVANPVGGVVGAATKAAGVADKADAIRDGISYGKARRKFRKSAGDDDDFSSFLAGEGHNRFLDDDGEFVGVGSFGGNRVNRIQEAQTAQGFGSYLGGGLERGSEARTAMQEGRETAGTLGVRAAAGAHLGASVLREDPARFLKNGAYQNGRNAVSQMTAPIGERFNKSARKERKQQRKERRRARYESAVGVLDQARDRMGKNKRLAEAMGEDEALFEQMAVQISPSRRSQSDEEALNWRLRGISRSNEGLQAMTGGESIDIGSLDVPEHTNSREVSIDAIVEHTGKPDHKLAAEAAHNEVGDLAKRAKEAWGDDIEIATGTASEWKLKVEGLDRDKSRTDLGREIKEMEALYTSVESPTDINSEAILKELGSFGEYQQEVAQAEIEQFGKSLHKQVGEHAIASGEQELAELQKLEVPDELTESFTSTLEGTFRQLGEEIGQAERTALLNATEAAASSAKLEHGHPESLAKEVEGAIGDLNLEGETREHLVSAVDAMESQMERARKNRREEIKALNEELFELESYVERDYGEVPESVLSGANSALQRLSSMGISAGEDIDVETMMSGDADELQDTLQTIKQNKELGVMTDSLRQSGLI